MNTTIKLSLVRGIAVLALPAIAAAQSVDTRWQAWIGCWAPASADAGAARAPGAAMRVCIAPVASQSAVEVTTITLGKVTDRSIIAANAEPRAVTRDGCTGTETARWSVTGQRVYVNSSLTCANGTRRSSSGVLAFTGPRQWLDVRGLAINGASSGIAVARFVAVEAADSAGIPAEVRAAMPVRTSAAEFAAVAASPPLTLADVADVATAVEPGVASAWLVERTRGLALAIDGKQLAALADNGVPASVIDVAVALAYPDVFGLAADSRAAQRRPGVQAAASESRNRGAYPGLPIYGAYYDPYLWYIDQMYYYGGVGRRYGFGYPYGYFGYGYGPGYGFGYPYGGYGSYGGTYYSGAPIVVVIGESGAPATHGRVVKGQGYTSGAGTMGPTAQGGGASAARIFGSSSSSASSSTSSAGSSGSSGSSSSSGGERTAVRKP